MIVDPDFADHWKTELLVNLTGSEASIRCLLRFWSHCQHRRQWRFDGMTPEILAAICKWPGNPEVFWHAMSQTFMETHGFKQGFSVIARNWQEFNSRLIHNWSAGQKGGRPLQSKKTLGLSKAKPIEKIEKIDRVCVQTFSSVKEAAVFFENEFPEVPVKISLTLLVEQKGKDCLTESYCRNWLKKEERRKKPKAAQPPIEARNYDIKTIELVTEQQARAEALAELAAFRNGHPRTNGTVTLTLINNE